MAEFCSQCAIYKDEEGSVYLIKYERNDYQQVLIQIEDLMK